LSYICSKKRIFYNIIYNIIPYIHTMSYSQSDMYCLK
jgi:hypothetical protein